MKYSRRSIYVLLNLSAVSCLRCVYMQDFIYVISHRIAQKKGAAIVAAP